MPESANELMHEVLESIQFHLETMDRTLKDLAHWQIRVCEDLNNFHRDAMLRD